MSDYYSTTPIHTHTHTHTQGNGKIVQEIKRADGKTSYRVLNWDGTTVPVVHQFDRHKLLQDYFVKQVTEQEFIPKWRESRGISGGG